MAGLFWQRFMRPDNEAEDPKQAHNKPVKKQLLVAGQEEARRGAEDSTASVPSP